MKNADKPAFPHTENTFQNKNGLTKREYFAAMADIPWNAILETLSIQGIHNPTVQQVLRYRAKLKLIEADALLAELDSTTSTITPS